MSECNKVREPDGIIASRKLWDCNNYNLQPGTKAETSLYDLDVVTARFAGNRGSGRQGIKLGDKASGVDKLFVSKLNWSNDGNWDYCDVEYRGFISDSMVSKHPTGSVTQGTSETPIQGHPNYRSATAWDGEFNKTGLGEGGNPNKYGRVLDAESGEFVKFGPLPDGRDGRPAARGRCDKKSTGPWCRLQGVTGYLTPSQVNYKYSILTKESNWWKDYHLYLGTISNPISSLVPVPQMPKNAAYKDYKSDWLFINFNIQTEKLGTNEDDKFYKLELEFLSSVGGWNQLIYPKGKNLNLDTESKYRDNLFSFSSLK